MKARIERVAQGSFAALLALNVVSSAVLADEGGVSFWAPGQFGSLSAVPTTPGFSVPLTYYHTSANASAEKNFIVGGNRTAGIDATGDLLFAFPTYTFEDPVLGGQAALSLGWALGNVRVAADIEITGPLGKTIFRRRTDSITGGSDLYGLGTLKWHDENNDYMAYTMVGAPTGAYQLSRTSRRE